MSIITGCCSYNISIIAFVAFQLVPTSCTSSCCGTLKGGCLRRNSAVTVVECLKMPN
ncbi:hypothetical protein DPMN_087046 [Dreissena polymorpha]|uniref:Uncharacterized protein n=1 Tax=Dreissena polymorpha TaxID=45954 RepID=A0A9D4QV85_DREPO|nr:hypothetical protein DPMN_087046 [Dreissena polymorpha]